MVDAPAPPLTVGALIDGATSALRGAGIEGARAEARWLLARVLNTSESDLLAHGERPVSPPAAARYQEMVARRAAREPFAYVVGERELCGRSVAVDGRVRVRRPETETLIEAAREVLDADGRVPLVVDVGTGS